MKSRILYKPLAIDRALNILNLLCEKGVVSKEVIKNMNEDELVMYIAFREFRSPVFNIDEETDIIKRFIIKQKVYKNKGDV
jgi:hypothetical protein